MAGKRLFWRLYPSYVLIPLLSMVAMLGYVSSALGRLNREQTEAGLKAQARLIEPEFTERLAAGDREGIAALCKELGASSSTRLTVVLPSGQVIGDSEQAPAQMEPHGDRPELLDAFEGRMGLSVHYSGTLRRDMMYVATPLWVNGRVAGAVRTSMALRAIGERLESTLGHIVWVGIAILAVASAVSWWAARRIARPIEEMKQTAERFARGDLAARLPSWGSEELDRLSEAMNLMAAQLDERIRTITDQRGLQEAILASMVEGVIAVDSDERVISLNHAAAAILKVKPEEAVGRSIQEMVRNLDLERLVARALEGAAPAEGDVVLREGEVRYLQAHGAVLAGEGGKPIGAVIVLNDVTRLRRLENIRRDFVANVSHELRTPITSIKGFVETLLDGAMKVPKDAERFLGVIAKQVDRLNAIIEDLLLLSKLEQEGKPGLAREECLLEPLLHGAVQVCELHATEKSVPIRLDCEQGLSAKANPALLEQVVVNLIDNAIKYSEAGSPVEIEARRTAREGEAPAEPSSGVVIRVRDHGCGIEKQHLPRLFERFYRVDKARSRKLGGTGLGLSIVKHIVQAHGGTGDVESTPGQGSTFSIHLPKD